MIDVSSPEEKGKERKMVERKEMEIGSAKGGKGINCSKAEVT